MELRDFAEQILFATTLEEKLAAPERITDSRPGAPIALPKAPGRPRKLRFKETSSGKADFPKLHQLEQEGARGRLLHFFANHELLATELMALVLLRFPDAPVAFRRGVLNTLRDEQAHTRMYMERMRECGVHFGELPVSGYFWRAISGMESPMDYVAGLSLTFEQANLDFCRHFAQGFESVGDKATADLLQRIYRDEIGHVAYGLKWFRRWKNPDESDWEAFCRQLRFPLSPSRAKGGSLNVEGRRAAGLDSEYIDRLSVYSMSKGRTPNVFWFNPLEEERIAIGRGFSATKRQRMLVGDLGNLPQFLCRQDDILLVQKSPSLHFLSEIKQAGFVLPEIHELMNGRIRGGADLAQRKIGALRPWAWGPEALELFKPLWGNVTGEEFSAEQRFNRGIAELYSKGWGAAFLKKILEKGWGEEPWVCGATDVGVGVRSLDEALAAVEAIRERGHHKVVVKRAYGLAGGNMIRLWEPAILEAQRAWMINALKNGGALVVEPWLERELDFSVQLEMGKGGLKLCGYTGLMTDHKGHFQANWAEPNHARRILSGVEVKLKEHRAISKRLQDLYENVFGELEKSLENADYSGPVGIDAFVYRTRQGECRLKPVVEINPRYTMGRLTVELMKRVMPGSYGAFRIVTRATILRDGVDEFAEYARALRVRFPLQLVGEPIAKIREGAIVLNDPEQAQEYLATFRVGPSMSVLEC